PLGHVGAAIVHHPVARLTLEEEVAAEVDVEAGGADEADVEAVVERRAREAGRGVRPQRRAGEERELEAERVEVRASSAVLVVAAQREVLAEAVLEADAAGEVGLLNRIGVGSG